ncbi:protein NipSnap homolog 3A isoform X2 [Procambarus clarkii]|uniref:protein NipSnap homolog 3A isoform X2 n=1 Tax=Procambarus clarkii TaxID=6728 RepID=UPI001E6700E5|nr:protein NipSnap homolog 3A-like isoform X2 [Procambarus clarkii]
MWPLLSQLSRVHLRLRTSLLASRNLTTSCCHQLDNRVKATQNTLYELRTYTLYPEKMREFLTLTEEHLHLRTAHSKLLGYWTSEIGGLNQVVHIWEYESLTHRAEVRARLAGDPEWLGRYVSCVIGMWQQQDNVLLALLPGTAIKHPSGKGVYELQTLHMKGPRSAWCEALVKHVRVCEEAAREGRSRAVGVWSSLLGPTHMAAVLWQHNTPDCCLALKAAADSLDMTLSSHVHSGHSKLLLPHAVSSLQ